MVKEFGPPQGLRQPWLALLGSLAVAFPNLQEKISREQAKQSKARKSMIVFPFQKGKGALSWGLSNKNATYNSCEPLGTPWSFLRASLGACCEPPGAFEAF